MVRTAEDAAYTRGYRAVVCNTDEDPVKQRSYLGMLAAERVAGAIISPTAEGALPRFTELIDLGICVVAFDRVVDDPRADAVLVDNVTGSRPATTHLIESGEVRVGFVGGPVHIQTAAERRAGYEEAMNAAGLESLVAEADSAWGAGLAASELIRQGATALLV